MRRGKGRKKLFLGMMRDEAGGEGIVTDEYRLLIGIGVKHP